MIRRPFLFVVAAALAGAAACGSSDATAPGRMTRSVHPSTRAADRDDDGDGEHDSDHVPGAVGAPYIMTTTGGMQGCTPRDAQYGTATIGPAGGELDVGTDRLIIPPGALTETVQVSGSSPAGTTPTIFFQPHGLRFRKSAGLILDASNCTDVPSVVYLSELGVDSPPIVATYSTWWHTVAAPIDHFSGYAVAF